MARKTAAPKRKSAGHPKRLTTKKPVRADAKPMQARAVSPQA